jgi:hypothetical protein
LRSGEPPVKRGPSLVGYAGAIPEQVAEDLARALAGLLCHGLRHPPTDGGSRADCLAAGRVLALPVGRALFACRRGGRAASQHARRLAQADYEVIGRSVELLEQLAGTRAASSD